MPFMVTIQPWVFITTCWSRQYDFNLVHHPTPENEIFFLFRTKKAPDRIWIQDPDHESRTYTRSRQLSYGRFGHLFYGPLVLNIWFLFIWSSGFSLMTFLSHLWSSSEGIIQRGVGAMFFAFLGVPKTKKVIKTKGRRDYQMPSKWPFSLPCKLMRLIRTHP